MSEAPHISIFPISDCALTIDFGNRLDEALNRRIISLFQQLKRNPLQGMIELVPAYSSLTVYYDVFELAGNAGSGPVFNYVKKQVEEILRMPVDSVSEVARQVRIPVCYDAEYAPDLDWMASQKNMSREELIDLHIGKKYRVYMIGFLPGFAYMGEIDGRLATPRRTDPRTHVEAGSVGIAGLQTGVYPVNSPGGWQLIGRTPVKLFNPENEDPVLLQAGDVVEFASITKEEFLALQL